MTDISPFDWSAISCAAELKVIIDPAEFSLSAQVSHICPGPSFGYSNSSIKEVILVFFIPNALIIARTKFKFLIR